MSWSGGGLFPPWGGLAPPNYRQPSSNQDQLRREAARRRHAEAANSLAEQRRKAGTINDGEDLFSGPWKTDGIDEIDSNIEVKRQRKIAKDKISVERKY